LQHPNAKRSPPWSSITYNCPKSELSNYKEYFTRNTPLTSNLDIKTYDVGNLFVCTNGQANTNLIGELWIEYDVEFTTPQLGNFIAGGKATGATSLTAANPLGTAATFDAQSFGVTVDGTSTVTFTYPGTYLVLFIFNGSVITAAAATAGTGATTAVIGSITINSGSTQAEDGFIVTTTINNATVAFTATATTVTSSTLSIGTVPALSLS